ncbi:phage antirepressor KilAC domain-containing protein [Pseudescherichia sp.]|uniref:phage antirepressor KilAC domain-containing protein n=1 Tax=Pseudescherichia sp. TaxID=2055881 RepID=UPI0028A02824|nr:phage antirepressor KilAC domain-containing protein [Pseudescherichia sp.]
MVYTNTIEALPIVIENHSFTCNDQRMWNLNEIHQVLNLPDSKAPSQWRTEVSRHMDRSANLQTVNGDNGGTWATEAGAIAYAMWVSTDFYLMVINAFIFMRNDAVLRERVAVLQADEANAALSIAAPKADIFDKRLANGGAVPWTQACRALSIPPRKLIAGLLGSGKFIKKFDYDRGDYYIQPPAEAFRGDYFRWKTVMDRQEWQVTARGVAWMQENASKWREAIARDDRQKAAAKRAAKRSRKVAA